MPSQPVPIAAWDAGEIKTGKSDFAGAVSCNRRHRAVGSRARLSSKSFARISSSVTSVGQPVGGEHGLVETAMGVADGERRCSPR